MKYYNFLQGMMNVLDWTIKNILSDCAGIHDTKADCINTASARSPSLCMTFPSPFHSNTHSGECCSLLYQLHSLHRFNTLLPSNIQMNRFKHFHKTFPTHTTTSPIALTRAATFLYINIRYHTSEQTFHYTPVSVKPE